MVVTLLAAILSLFVLFGARLRRMTRDALDALSDAMGTMTESLSNIRLVKAFAREPHEDRRAEERLRRVFTLTMRSSAVEGAFGTVAFSGFILVLMGVVWYGGRSVLTGRMSAGSLLAFFMNVTIISGPMGGMYETMSPGAFWLINTAICGGGALTVLVLRPMYRRLLALDGEAGATV